MDWSNEDYVRVYTRDTADDLELSWQAMALWHSMLRKFDRSGVIPVRNGWSSVAKIVRMPDDVVAAAGKELERDGRVLRTKRGMFAPNFTEAQTTRKSDKSRQRESRDQRRREAAGTAGTDEQAQTTVQDDESIEPCHTVSPTGHTQSHDVTLSVADPLLRDTDPSADARISPVPDPAAELTRQVIGEINRLTGRRFDPESDANQKLCRGLIRNKHTADDALLVVKSKAEWVGDPKMDRHFTPSTLLGPHNFAKYLDEARAGPSTAPLRFDGNRNERPNPIKPWT